MRDAIDGGEGVLLIIKNYTGDILNFETATELLHESGIKSPPWWSTTTWR